MSKIEKLGRSYLVLACFLVALLAGGVVLVLGVVHIPKSDMRWTLCLLALPITGFTAGTSMSLLFIERHRRIGAIKIMQAVPGLASSSPRPAQSFQAHPRAIL